MGERDVEERDVGAASRWGADGHVEEIAGQRRVPVGVEPDVIAIPRLGDNGRVEDVSFDRLDARERHHSQQGTEAYPAAGSRVRAGEFAEPMKL